MIRVLIAEDSAATREYLVSLLDADPALGAAGIARDGMEAVEQAERLRPDVILMDVHMPRLNGFEATRLIMERVPTPIVVVSASYSRDQEALTFEALRAGALAVVEKPPGPDHPGQPESARKLRETLRLMAEVKVVRRWPRRVHPAPPGPPPVSAAAPGRPLRLVAIGASTGGPAALCEILEELPGDLEAPILVVQHIAPGFTQGLVEWLDQGTELVVKLAQDGEQVRPGTVYVAPEGAQMGITAAGRIQLDADPGSDGFRPSASHLLAAVTRAYGRSALGVILTGMGRDGAQALLHLREAGGTTIAQDEATSVVFGMPGEAVRLGAAQYVLSPARIAETIRLLVGPD